MKIGPHETHPAADVFPLLEGEELDALVEDLRAHGQLEPCWRVWVEAHPAGRRPLVLDGRNRLRACMRLGLQPRWRDYEGDCPTAFVLSLNLRRRHLLPAQRAAVGVEALPLFEAEAKERQRSHGGTAPGRPSTGGTGATSEGGRARDQAGATVGVSGRSIQTAKKVAAEAPDVFEAMKRGALDLATAAKAAKLEAKQRSEVLRRVKTGEAKDGRAAVRQVQRAAAVAVIEREPQPLPDGPFRVITADPPWDYGKRKDDGSHRGAISYPTMTTAEICAMPVGERAHDDSLLWLWTTNAFMRDAFAVIDAWGFADKTILTWAKNKMGAGDWLRGKTEHCVLAVRGAPVVSLTNQTTLLEAAVREHSRKPDAFYDLVEALCPGSKLEVFARQSRPGWTTWGAEHTQFDAEPVTPSSPDGERMP